jgi:hypothetical protein
LGILLKKTAGDTPDDDGWRKPWKRWPPLIHGSSSETISSRHSRQPRLPALAFHVQQAGIPVRPPVRAAYGSWLGGADPPPATSVPQGLTSRWYSPRNKYAWRDQMSDEVTATSHMFYVILEVISYLYLVNSVLVFYQAILYFACHLYFLFNLILSKRTFHLYQSPADN